MFDQRETPSAPPAATRPDPVAERAELEVLETRICTLAGHLAAATCRFLLLLADFDARRGWASWDMPSCAAWLSWKCQMSSSTAREHVRVARALPTLPVTRAEFEAGRLSYAKVRALTRIATPDTEADLAEMAGPMTANQLDRFARAHRTVTRNMDEQARRWRRLTWRLEDDGSLSLSVRLPPEDGAAVLTALRAVLRDAAPPDTTSPDTAPPVPDAGEEAVLAGMGSAGVDASAEARPAGAAAACPGGSAGASAEARPTPASLADALVEIAEAYLAGKTKTAENPDVYQVILHASADALVPETLPEQAPETVADTSPALCHVEDGPAVSRTALQMIACDAVRSWITHHPDGLPLNVGRRRREPTPAIRRALAARDKCRCRYPGCGRRASQAHHIIWWLYDGETSLDNLVSLCKYHHRLIHEGRTTIGTPAPGVFTFYGRDGTQILESPPLPAPHGSLADQHDADISADTIVPPWYGDRLDLDYAIAVLFGNQRVREAKRQAALAA